MRTFSAALALAFLVPLASAQMVSGRGMTHFDEALGIAGRARFTQLEVQQVACSAGPNVLWPGETATLTYAITNRSGASRALRGVLRTVAYRTSVPPGDIWVPTVYGLGVVGETPVTLDVAADATASLEVTPKIGERFGGYALILDLGEDGVDFVGTLARVDRGEPGRVHIPTYALDMPWPHEMSDLVPITFKKLGVKGCRMGASYTPTSSANFETEMAGIAQFLEQCKANDITVMLTIGAGSAPQPLDRGRPWLNSDDTLQVGVKEDLAWLPSYDEDFRKYVATLCRRFGWPNGPVNGVELWNEPWEGVSISGWGADLPRYREIYKQMALGVMDARQDGVKVLIGGASSSSNTLDKLFPDGSDEFLPYLDFVSIHYQGTGAIPCLVPMWMNRAGEYGRVQVWDTESWVANSDDRVVGVVASMRSFGQDRAMGTYGGNVYTPDWIRVGEANHPRVQAWAMGAGVAAAAKYIGQRRFERLLFQNGLPWVYVFRSDAGREDDTLVVLGSLTVNYGPNEVLFRQAQAAVVAKPGRLVLPADKRWKLIDQVGNPIPPRSGKVAVPLDGLGYVLRGDGRPGSFDALVDAVESARIEGYPPAEIVAHDFLDDTLRVTLTNVLNRAVEGKLTVTLAGQRLSADVRLDAGEERTVRFAKARPATNSNLFPCEVTFDAGADGVATHAETLRRNLIAKLSPQVDGDLSDWGGALPQTIQAQGLGTSTTEAAWLPFIQRRDETGAALTTAWAAYDEAGFYFAARIGDPTPYAGNIRFATRDDDRYYYPAVSYETGGGTGAFSARWTGELVSPVDGRLELVTISDDGVRLWVDDQLVIDHWADHGPERDIVAIPVEKGAKRRLRLEYYNGGGGGVIELRWVLPGTAETAIPAEGFAAPLSAEYFADRDLQNRVLTTTDATLNKTTPNFPPPEFAQDGKRPLVWPEGVRRFSYRMDPDLPSGNGTDNVQIAFNVRPPDKKDWWPHPAGVMPRYMAYPDSDYEYALNSVSAEHGGGYEVWRMLAPGMPRKHFYPRQPKAPVDGGPVENAKLIVRRVGEERVVEAFLPWDEVPLVKEAMEQGRPIKFSFRVNDSAGPSYELAQGRSVSKENFLAFHNDWAKHWANELEFAFER